MESYSAWGDFVERDERKRVKSGLSWAFFGAFCALFWRLNENAFLVDKMGKKWYIIR